MCAARLPTHNDYVGAPRLLTATESSGEQIGGFTLGGRGPRLITRRALPAGPLAAADAVSIPRERGQRMTVAAPGPGRTVGIG
jgi:hypothetical protein